jgi:lipopolysaccharide O-acetyltransferase
VRLRGGAAAHRFAIRTRDKLFSLLIKGSFAAFGRHSVIQMPARISGEDRIAIGDGVFVGAGSWLQVLDECETDVAIEIGPETSIVGGCVLSAAQHVRLGRGVLLARNVYIADHTHAFEDLDAPVREQGVVKIAAVEIADGAWLGQNVVIGPGVRVGRGSVVGANSVVRESIPDHSVAAGAPARVLRTFAEGSAPARP